MQRTIASLAVADLHPRPVWLDRTKWYYGVAAGMIPPVVTFDQWNSRSVIYKSRAIGVTCTNGVLINKQISRKLT